MSGLRWLQLSEEELTTFLGSGGIGVLAFATDDGDPPYTVPVSYGHVGAEHHLHFRLALPEGSAKATFLDRPVSFVTHDRTDDGWRSVVATGHLEDLAKASAESSATQERWAVHIPLVDIFEEPSEDVSFREFRLVPDDVTGRKEVRSGE